MPEQAVIGGYWMDLSLLYIVKQTFDRDTVSGYYSESRMKAYMPYRGVNHPRDMYTLVQT